MADWEKKDSSDVCLPDGSAPPQPQCDKTGAFSLKMIRSLKEKLLGQENPSENPFAGASAFIENHEFVSLSFESTTKSPGTNVCSHPSRALVLHYEILQLVRLLEPSEEEKKMREQVLSDIQNASKEIWPRARVGVFGSCLTQTMLPDSDMDLVVFGIPESSRKGHLYRLASALRKYQMVSKLEVIAKARVPIIKLTHKETGIAVDISFNHTSGIESGEYINECLKKFPVLRPLTIALKLFLQQRGVNETFSGGIGSFLLQLMIISMLQMHPQVGIRMGSRGLRVKRSREGREIYFNLGYLLLNFFELYGRLFNYKSVGISVRNGGCYFHKAERQWDDYDRPNLLSVENPLDPSHDVGKNSYNIVKIRRMFEDAFYILISDLGSSSVSGLLDRIIDTDKATLGRTNYKTFSLQLERSITSQNSPSEELLDDVSQKQEYSQKQEHSQKRKKLNKPKKKG